MIELLVGLVTGVVITYAILDQRVKDQKEFSERIIEQHKEGFKKGFEVSNGYTPFVERENEVHSSETDYQLDEQEEEETERRYRWDD